MVVRIGTAGWSNAGWTGPFYPKGTPPEKQLRHYATRFGTVEVNTTFYATPQPTTLQHWIEQAAGWPGFEFSVKAPRKLTEETLTRGRPVDARDVATEFRDAVLAPLRPNLGAVLLQLPPLATRSAPSLALIDAALDALRGFELAVEPRHPSWLRGRELLDVLDAHDAALVLFDGPHMPATEAGTATHAYLRFHGRNADVWKEYGKVEADENDPRENRYDYAYSTAELAPWAARIAALEKRKRVVRVYFNNHPGAHAPHDADVLAELLAAEGADVEKVPKRGQQRLEF